MRLEIERTLGIERAAIDLEPGQIVEVVGPNASGKTSLAVCAQAVLARESNPLGLSAADAKRSYPHDGADDAVVELSCSPKDMNYDGAWHPSRGTIATAAEPFSQRPSAPEAVGLVDFTAKRGAKERAAVFQNALLPDPMTVLAAVKETLSAYLPEADLVGVMEMLGERGWEPTEAVYTERGRQAKREWREVTNKNYGVRVATDWRPDGWLVDFDLLTVQEAEAAVTDARDALNAMHRVQAVSETDVQRARDAAIELPGLEAKIAALQEQQDAVDAELSAIPVVAAFTKSQGLNKALEDARRELSEKQDCPHCGEGLAIRRNKIERAAPSTDIERRIREIEVQHADAVTAHADLQDKAQPLAEGIKQLGAEILTVNNDLRTAKRDAAKGGEVQSESDRVALAQAEQTVEDAREVVRLVKAEADAARLHQTIARYADIARALGPEGVRAKMLANGLAKLNAGLHVISSAADWYITSVEPNGSIQWGARPIALCSESERWRAQAAIQLTLGAITGSKVVVLDRGDLLDATNRQGLVRAVERVVGKTGMAVLLCSTGYISWTEEAPWPQVAIKDGRTA